MIRINFMHEWPARHRIQETWVSTSVPAPGSSVAFADAVYRVLRQDWSRGNAVTLVVTDVDVATYDRQDPVSGTELPSGVEGTSLGRGSTGDGE